MTATLLKLGHTPNDTQEVKLRKSFLTYLAMFMSLGGLVWGSIALAYGLTWQSLIPYGYVVLSIINLTILGTTKKFTAVRRFQIFISLALPFMFQWALGGFYSSGFIMLWAVLSLIASLSFSKGSSSFTWLGIFLALTLASAVLEPYFAAEKPSILPAQSLLFTTVNICMIISMVFLLVAYYVGQQNSTREKLMLSQSELEVINRDLVSAQREATKKNKELQAMKNELVEITERQTRIYQELMHKEKKARAVA